MTAIAWAEAAAALAEARREQKLTEPLPDELVIDDAIALTVQDAAVQALGQPVSGWKIGATAAAAQALLGRDRPFYGPMPAPDCYGDGEPVPLPPGVRGVEVEIAFKLAQDLPRRERGYTLAEIKAAVASVHPAIEIIAVRQRVQEPVRSQVLVADFGGHAGFVHGPEIPDWRQLDLAGIKAVLLIDGEAKANGGAESVMGNPWNALLWLADNGPGLDAGHWVSSGTMTGLTAVTAGQTITGDLGPYGKVTCKLV